MRFRRGQRAALLLRWFGWIARTATVLLVIGWIAGRAISDRTLTGQYLLWIPTPVVALVCAVLAFTAMRRSWRYRRRWFALAALALGWFLVVEHRFLRFGRSDEGPRIMHWSLAQPGPEKAPAFAEIIGQLDADVIVISNAGNTMQQDAVRASIGDRRLVRLHPFLIITSLEIAQMRIIMHSPDHGRAARLDLMIDGERAILHLYDLPSDPRRSRAQIAAAIEEVMADQDGPDITIGDFNMTRGSASTKRIVNGMTHAYDQAGRGYDATFHRAFPLYHIDHVYLGPDWEATKYDTVNLGLGRHRAQTVAVRRAGRSAAE